MKTLRKTSMIVFALFVAAQVTNAQQQILFQGLVSQGMGGAGWNADGTGPEPAATGHQVPFPGFGNIYYYIASRDYISGNHDHAAFAFLPGITGFPNFTQALITHGFTPGQVKARFGLVTLGADEEGLDWFVMGNVHHSSYKHSGYSILELNSEPMLAIKANYSVWTVQAGTTTWIIDFGYTPVMDISGSSSPGVQVVAQAFLADLDGKSIRLQCESNYGGMTITGNGRNGALYNIINGTLTVGNPTLPFKGLFADNEGFAGWDADGAGPEPFGNGHDTQLYYGASLDYGGINANPNACLGHLLEGSSGFQNTLLQLQYRGIDIGNLKIKLGLNSLGPDVYGEDWGYENGKHWCNYYNSHILFELNGEPILKILADTNKLVSMLTYWKSGASVGKVYDISENASPAAQFVAQSFLRDMGSHYLNLITDHIQYVTLFSGNGRDGAIYQIPQGRLLGSHKNITFVPPGEVSGTWAAEGSPYYVDGHLEIADGETLIIESGVKVAMRGPYHFTVQGCVNAEGTEDEKIIFTRSNPNLYWDGFDYDETPSTNETSVFDHCLFEYGRGQGVFPLNCGGTFSIRGYDNVHISNSVFRYNKADIGGYINRPSGGAISLWGSSPVIKKCIFYENYGKYYGGAILSYLNSYPVISNCLFYENNSERGGALSFYDNSGGILINNTIADNNAVYGAGIHLHNQSNPQSINNIIWENAATVSGNQVYTIASNNAGFYYCNIEGGLSGFGGAPFSGPYLFNLNEDPLFSNTPEMPYMLLNGSPCKNMGTPDSSAWYYPQHLPETCLAGNPRILNGRIDLGAYEHSGILAGDANCDGIVNVLDVIAMINYVLGYNPEPFCFENADIDGNGSINVLDVTAAINIIISGKAAPFPYLKSASAHIYLNPDNITLQSDGTLAGLQFELFGVEAGKLNLLPEGFELAVSQQGNKLLGLLYSMNNTPIPPGTIILFELKDETTRAQWGEVFAANRNAEIVQVLKHQAEPEHAISKFRMNVYPNPFREGAMISYPLAQETTLRLSVHNQLGQEIMVLSEGKLQQGQYQFELDAASLPPGIYFLRLQTAAESTTRKIIKY